TGGDTKKLPYSQSALDQGMVISPLSAFSGFSFNVQSPPHKSRDRLQVFYGWENNDCRYWVAWTQYQNPLPEVTLQDNRQTSDNRFKQSTTTITHFHDPLQITKSTNIHQSDRGGLYSFRTIGRLVTTASNNQPLRLPTSMIHFKSPNPPTFTSLTVAGFTASGQSADW
ncbi:hypothetical protein N7465_001638, partial [Penicillium sp. CMV-2018d]